MPDLQLTFRYMYMRLLILYLLLMFVFFSELNAQNVENETGSVDSIEPVDEQAPQTVEKADDQATQADKQPGIIKQKNNSHRWGVVTAFSYLIPLQSFKRHERSFIAEKVLNRENLVVYDDTASTEIAGFNRPAIRFAFTYEIFYNIHSLLPQHFSSSFSQMALQISSGWQNSVFSSRQAVSGSTVLNSQADHVNLTSVDVSSELTYSEHYSELFLEAGLKWFYPERFYARLQPFVLLSSGVGLAYLQQHYSYLADAGYISAGADSGSYRYESIINTTGGMSPVYRFSGGIGAELPVKEGSLSVSILSGYAFSIHELSYSGSISEKRTEAGVETDTYVLKKRGLKQTEFKHIDLSLNIAYMRAW